MILDDAYWQGPLPQPLFDDFDIEREVMVPMRDGVRLSTDVYLPRGAEGPLPTVLVKTPYDKDDGEGSVRTKWVDYFARQGYAVVVQNERGFRFSEGVFVDYLAGAGTDGPDTVAWILEQPWSNGRVGTIGCSSSGEHQWPMASANAPGHVAMVPGASGTAVGDVPGNDTCGAFYKGGIPMLFNWANWYGRLAPTEKPVIPAGATQEERQRIRKYFQFSARKGWAPDTAEQLRHLPSKDVLSNAGAPVSPFDRYMTRTPADPAWNEVELIGEGDEPRVPALHINTWHDLAIGETTRLFSYLQSLDTPEQYLIIGGGPHCAIWQELPFELTKKIAKEMFAGFTTTEIDAMPAPDMRDFVFGDLKLGDVRYRGVDHGYPKLYLAWFDKWVRGTENGVADMPKVQLFVMHQGWISAESWPPPAAVPTTFHLVADPEAWRRNEAGGLSTDPSAEESEDSYVYDPMNPTPNLGGVLGFNAALDQRPISARRDVLVYSTPPLEQAITVAGPVEVTLDVSTSARDTDFIVRLVDVLPDGTAINLADDGFRLRYRAGFDQAQHAEEGQVYRITLPNMVTGNRFQEGHRIRLEISSSSFPAYERNLNTGGANFDEIEGVVARNAVHYGGSRASSVTLPVIPD
ncbi:CocE/NonD family hydrolase [Dactylosporangium sp. CA-233914]|uniref:CocE/NonD family hydrolase n=1 Tax=Dactylosporangium sp. CA-233914 TaxID=3239934 RepID=UPI003D90D6A2